MAQRSLREGLSEPGLQIFIARSRFLLSTTTRRRTCSSWFAKDSGDSNRCRPRQRHRRSASPGRSTTSPRSARNRGSTIATSGRRHRRRYSFSGRRCPFGVRDLRRGARTCSSRTCIEPAAVAGANLVRACPANVDRAAASGRRPTCARSCSTYAAALHPVFHAGRIGVAPHFMLGVAGSGRPPSGPARKATDVEETFALLVRA